VENGQGSVIEEQGRNPATLRSLPAWLPIPLLLGAIVLLRAANLQESYEPLYLVASLDLVFSLLVFLSVVYLISRSFLIRPQFGLLMLGCGVLIWALAGFVARADADMQIAIYSMSVWLSALCHLTGVVFSLRSKRTVHPAGPCLATGYMVALGLLGLVALSALEHWMPTFFVQGRGGTPLRQLVLGSAIAMFGLTAALLGATNRKGASAFTRWYALALALTAVGLFGVTIQTVHGSVLGWTGRATQYLAGAYMLIAAVASVRESRVWGISLQAALTESQERYRTLFETAPDGIVVHRDGWFLCANSATLRLAGADSFEELARHTVLDFFRPQDRLQAAEQTRAAMTANKLPIREATLRRLDGQEFAVEFHTSTFDFEGTPAILTIIRDITDRKQAEEALRENQALVHAVVDGSPDLIYLKDLDGRVLMANPAACAALGKSPEEVIGKTAREFYSEDPDVGRVIMENDRHIMESGETQSLEELGLKDRTYLSTKAPYRDAAGNVIGLIGISHDITDRKQAEQELGADVAALTRMHALSTRLLGADGPKSGLQEIMDAAVAIMGAERGVLQLIEGDSLRIVAHCGHQPPFLNFFASAERRASVCGEALKCGQRVIVEDVEHSRLFADTALLRALRDAGVRAVQSTPLRDRQGKLLGILATQWSVPHIANEHDLRRLDLLARQAADFIEHKQAEEALRNANEDLRAQAEQLQTANELLEAKQRELEETNECLREQEKEMMDHAEALRTSQERLALAVSGTRIGIYDWDIVTGEVLWADQVARLLGLCPTTTLPQPYHYRDWAERVHPEDLPRVEAELHRCMAERTTFEPEYRVVWPDGSVHWLAGRGVFEYDPDGQCTRMLGLLMDITDRKQAEMTLRASEAVVREQADRLATVLEAAPAIIWIAHDRDCRKITGNRAAREFSRVADPDADLSKTGPAPERLAHYRIFANGVELQPQDMPIQVVARSGKELRGHAAEFRFDDGTRRSLTGNIIPLFDAQGRSAGAIAAFLDITAREEAQEALRESQQRFTVLTQNVSSGVALVDEQGRFSIVNPAFLRMFGLSEDSEIKNINDRNWGHWQVYDERGALLDVDEHPVRKAAMTKMPVRNRLVGVRAPTDTDLKWMLISAEPLLKPDGRLDALICTYHDVTDRRRAEEALRELNATLERKVAARTVELERRNRQLQRLTLELSQAEDRERKRVAEILHEDLQQQIAGAKFHLSLLRSRFGHDPSHEAVAARLDELLKDAIEKSRSLSHELSPAVLHRNDLAEILHWLANHMQDKHGLKVRIDVCRGATLRSEALAVFLFRAAQEMLFNVVKHAEVDHAAIRVRWIGRCLGLSVLDRGCGFDPQELQETPGLGLLSLHERVESLGGRMKISSAKGKGSRFRIVVPDGQTPENGGQKTEDGRKRTEDRGQRREPSEEMPGITRGKPAARAP
jgi:PAS domain S-box-containing protein